MDMKHPAAANSQNRKVAVERPLSSSSPALEFIPQKHHSARPEHTRLAFSTAMKMGRRAGRQARANAGVSTSPPIARAANSSEILPNGTEGVLAFLDASASSYPNFVLSEDFGVVDEGRCGCGRYGQRLTITRRINRIESRGCALKMAIEKTGDSRQEGYTRYYASVFRNPDLHRRGH